MESIQTRNRIRGKNMQTKIYRKIDKISSLWNKLYKNGMEMSFFQSYEWNTALEINFQEKKFENYRKTLLYYVFDNSLIAPIIIDKAKKQITILGQNEPSDYLSFIFNKFDEELFTEAITLIMKDYQSYTFLLDKINESNPMVNALQQGLNQFNIQEVDKDCVYVPTQNGKETFYSSLSKRARQNYRTAKNKLQKEGHFFCLKIGTDIVSEHKAQELYNLYKSRRDDCDYRNVILKKILKALKLIKNNIFQKKSLDVLTSYSQQTKVFLSEIYIDDELAAFCEGNYNNRANVISIARIATNNKFYSYSPGQILLIDTIEYIRNKVVYFDLTRGAEDYKFKLGGVRHTNKCFTIYSER